MDDESRRNLPILITPNTSMIEYISRFHGMRMVWKKLIKISSALYKKTTLPKIKTILLGDFHLLLMQLLNGLGDLVGNKSIGRSRIARFLLYLNSQNTVIN